MTDVAYYDRTDTTHLAVDTEPAEPQVINAKVIHYVDRYQGFARKTAQSLIALAGTLVDAQAALDPKDFEEFCQLVRLEKGSSTYKKMMIIGKAAGRFEPVMDQLPNAWTVLYELAKLKPAPFEQLVSGQQLHPLMTGQEVKQLTSNDVSVCLPNERAFLKIAEIHLPQIGSIKETETAVIEALKNVLEPFSSYGVRLESGYPAAVRSAARVNNSAAYGDSAAAKHLERLERWLLYCLRKKAPQTVPPNAQKMVHTLGLSCEIQDGPMKPLPNKPNVPLYSILKPTMAEFEVALSEEFLKLAGPKRFLALLVRAEVPGEWKEETKQDGKLVSKQELKLKFFRQMMKGAEDETARAEYKATVEQILNYLPESLAELSDIDLARKATEWIKTASEDF